MAHKWTKESITLEILHLQESGEPLNYSYIFQNDCSLLRAAIRYFGTWEAAVNASGLDYNQCRIYQSWTRERIISKIQELHAENADLSWGHVLVAHASLAAAATKKTYFGSWGYALECAGLDYETIRRYREWDKDRIVKEVQKFYTEGQKLNAKSMEEADAALIAAARRRFEIWNQALTAAGLDYHEIAERASFRRGLGRGQNPKKKNTKLGI